MTMAKKNITIGFPEEKLNVLLYFLNREQQNLEPLLEEQLDRLYNLSLIHISEPTRPY